MYFNIRCNIYLKIYLNSRSDKDPAIFVTERVPHRERAAHMRYIIKRISQRAGVNKTIHSHQLRHSYATHVLNNGAPLEVIQGLLGYAAKITLFLLINCTLYFKFHSSQTINFLTYN
ncbi:tyrosine-type recombinase/integrase [Virgibacillus oceani]